jgi:hypothetical protein
MKLPSILAAGILSLLALPSASAQTIVVIEQTNTHKVLTIDSTSTAEHVPLVMADYVNTPNQRWTLHSAGGGKYYIYNTADGRALEATTFDENAQLYATNLNWGDTSQMWRFTQGFGIADKRIASAFNGLSLTIDQLNTRQANPPVIQTTKGHPGDMWVIVPVHTQPSCSAVTAKVGLVSIGGVDRDDYRNLAVNAEKVRNAIRVGFWIWNELDPANTTAWQEASFDPRWDQWGNDVLVPSEPASNYRIDAYALGADNEWHYLGSTSQVVGQPLQPPRS